MTRVACDIGQPRRMDTCGAEEPYEENLRVRFCGGIGRAIADPTRTGDAFQAPLLLPSMVTSSGVPGSQAYRAQESLTSTLKGLPLQVIAGRLWPGHMSPPLPRV